MIGAINKEDYPAHIRAESNNGQVDDVVQSVASHCRSVASYARCCLEGMGLSDAAYLVGLLHDCGKYTEAFRKYLWDSYQGRPVRRGSVNHTFAGVQYLLKNYHGVGTWKKWVTEVLAYAIGAHHGLFDLMKDGREYGFPHRLNTVDNGYHEAMENFFKYCASEEELAKLFASAHSELVEVRRRIKRLLSNSERCHDHFYNGLLARMLLSAVIEGDRRDTAEFTFGSSRLSSFRADRRLWNECIKFLDHKLLEFSHDTDIQMARAIISDRCKEKAGLARGIYRLNVPTGGGKTLASLRYALSHAVNQGKSRLIFVIPLLSIIDQNSKVLKENLPLEDLVLEHHSNVIHDGDLEDGDQNNECSPAELLAENWDAPIIITTLVQMLNTMFSGKSSCIRRFQSLCNSVIVFDEVQTVPIYMLSLFNLTINFLSEVCGATVVLCSATQPCLEDVAHPLFCKPESLVPYEENLWKPFKRTAIEDAGSYSSEELPKFILGTLRDHNSLLVVCNKKAEAASLYHALSRQLSHVFHLSASMCMAHRKSTLKHLKEKLGLLSKGMDKVLCISTQVIEAGVDISFDCVIRLCAGMDSVVQSAGRCNRNGESEAIAPVYLVQVQDEVLRGLRDIQNAQNATCQLLAEYRQNPENYNHDLASDKAISYYYRSLYDFYNKDNATAMDFPLGDNKTKRESKEAKGTVLSLLSDNKDSLENGRKYDYVMKQSFELAGKSFHVFEENTVDVLVPYDKVAKNIICDLCSAKALKDLRFVKVTLAKAKAYTVSLFQWQFEKLKSAGALSPIGQGLVWVLSSDYYNSALGVVEEPVEDDNKEVVACNFQI